MNPRSLGRRLTAATLFGIAAYYALLGGEYSVIDLWRLSAAERAEAERLARTTAELDSLRTLETRLAEDRATIEAIARERFGMIRNGEILYRFVDVGEPTETAIVVADASAKP